MSNGIKMTIVAVAAFVLGFLVARQLAPRGEGPEQPGLSWEIDGQSVVLTAQTVDRSYAVASVGEDPPQGLPPGTVPVVHRSGSMRISLESGEAWIFQIFGYCEVSPKGVLCNPCYPPYAAPKCGVPPPPPPPDQPWRLSILGN